MFTFEGFLSLLLAKRRVSLHDQTYTGGKKYGKIIKKKTSDITSNKCQTSQLRIVWVSRVFKTSRDVGAFNIDTGGYRVEGRSFV